MKRKPPIPSFSEYFREQRNKQNEAQKPQSYSQFKTHRYANGSEQKAVLRTNFRVTEQNRNFKTNSITDFQKHIKECQLKLPANVVQESKKTSELCVHEIKDECMPEDFEKPKKPSFIDKFWCFLAQFKARPNCPPASEWRQRKAMREAEEAAARVGMKLVPIGEEICPKLLPGDDVCDPSCQGNDSGSGHQSPVTCAETRTEREESLDFDKPYPCSDDYDKVSYKRSSNENHSIARDQSTSKSKYTKDAPTSTLTSEDVPTAKEQSTCKSRYNKDVTTTEDQSNDKKESIRAVSTDQHQSPCKSRHTKDVSTDDQSTCKKKYERDVSTDKDQSICKKRSYDKEVPTADDCSTTEKKYKRDVSTTKSEPCDKGQPNIKAPVKKNIATGKSQPCITPPAKKSIPVVKNKSSITPPTKKSIPVVKSKPSITPPPKKSIPTVKSQPSVTPPAKKSIPIDKSRPSSLPSVKKTIPTDKAQPQPQPCKKSIPPSTKNLADKNIPSVKSKPCVPEPKASRPRAPASNIKPKKKSFTIIKSPNYIMKKKKTFKQKMTSVKKESKILKKITEQLVPKKKESVPQVKQVPKKEVKHGKVEQKATKPSKSLQLGGNRLCPKLAPHCLPNYNATPKKSQESQKPKPEKKTGISLKTAKSYKQLKDDDPLYNPLCPKLPKCCRQTCEEINKPLKEDYCECGKYTITKNNSNNKK